MREPSASHLALAMLCAHPFTSGLKWPPEEKGDHALVGDRVHLGCEGAITGEVVRPAMYAGLDDAGVRRVERCVERAREHLDDTVRRFGDNSIEIMAELSMRYDVEGGIARLASGRSEPKRPGEWTTIADVVVIVYANALPWSVHVIDWKTGQQKHTIAAAKNPQMRLGALTAARIFGVRRATVELVYLDQDAAWSDRASFGALELATIAAEMRQLRRSLTGGPTPPVPGAHCTQHYCKLVGVCAATQSALATALPVGERFSVQLRDDEHARWTLERLPGARAALDAVERSVKDYAKGHPIKLADGKVYGWREAQKRLVDVDTPEREAALRDALGVFADVAIKRETSVTLDSIEEAARQAAEAAGEKRGKAGRERAALAKLAEAGGLRIETYPKCETFKPKEAGL